MSYTVQFSNMEDVISCIWIVINLSIDPFPTDFCRERILGESASVAIRHIGVFDATVNTEMYTTFVALKNSIVLCTHTGLYVHSSSSCPRTCSRHYGHRLACGWYTVSNRAVFSFLEVKDVCARVSGVRGTAVGKV